jgi:hypothetical protein
MFQPSGSYGAGWMWFGGFFRGIGLHVDHPGAGLG